MMNISMAYTTPSIVNEDKELTSRNWTPFHARKYKKDGLTQAYSKSPQWGGEPVGILKVISEPLWLNTSSFTLDEFYRMEGFRFLDTAYNKIRPLPMKPLREVTKRWIEEDGWMWRLPFEIVEIYPGMQAKYSTDKEIIRCVEKLIEVLP